MPRHVSSDGAISPKTRPPAHKSVSLPLPVTTVNLEASIANSTSEASSLHDLSLSGKASLGWVSKLLPRRQPRRSTSNLGLGPSGAVIFKGRRSCDSVVSTNIKEGSTRGTQFVSTWPCGSLVSGPSVDPGVGTHSSSTLAVGEIMVSPNTCYPVSC